MLARELGVDIGLVPGSGPGGRISAEDVKGYVRGLNLAAERATPAEPALTPLAAPALPDFSRWGEVVREPMSSIRRTTARRLSQAWVGIPHVTHFEKADITELEELRKRYAPKAEAAGGKLTTTAILLKIVASALKLFPKFNASLDMAGQEIVYKHYYHIGIAVDTEHGLLVPVIRDVDRKNILQLALELTQVSEKARGRKISLEDLEGGTFTITNLGGIGGTNFAPIINPPEVAILGVARASMEPVFKEGAFVPRLMLPLSLSYDHRLIDGADAARFMRWLAQAVEQPFLLSLEG
jgi:pyruvate dehydrogenase E2 component (dihydrolipoamide acetyltransferase)